VNRVFILGTIQHIQPITSGQTSEYHIIVQAQEGWTDKYGNQKTQTEQHYIVFDHSLSEQFKQLQIGQSLMLQGQLKTKQNGQYPQFKCASYIQAVQLVDLNALLELDDIEDNDGLPFPKQLVNSLWSK
ncbi:MAG: hypothetical protein RSC48_08075, partial [Anaerorhabdus sp.]